MGRGGDEQVGQGRQSRRSEVAVKERVRLTLYHRLDPMFQRGEAIRPMIERNEAISARARRAGLGLAVGLALLAGGCQMRTASPGDVTGSIGQTSVARTPDQLRAESAGWASRYEANRNDRDAAFHYARTLRALDQHSQALAILQAAVLTHGNDKALLGAYGRALADNGRLQEADEVLSRAHSPERPDWRILSAQGTVADQLGQHPRAQQLYEQALKLAPGEPTIMSNLGLSLALTKQLPAAERVLREAAASPQADRRVRQNLVLVLGLQGRFQDAEEIARRDQSPAEAQATVAQLRRSVSQQNSWQMMQDKNRPQQRRPAATNG